MTPEQEYDSYGFKGFWSSDTYLHQPDDPLFLRPHPLVPDRYSLYGVAYHCKNRIGILPVNAIAEVWSLKDFDDLMEHHDVLSQDGYECEVMRDDAKLTLLLKWCRDNVSIGSWSFRYESNVKFGQAIKGAAVRLLFYFTDKGEASLFKLFNS